MFSQTSIYYSQHLKWLHLRHRYCISHRHDSVRVECLIIHAALEVALVLLLSAYLSETAHILPRHPHTRGMESNNLMGKMNITWLKSIKTFTTCFIKITSHTTVTQGRSGHNTLSPWYKRWTWYGNIRTLSDDMLSTLWYGLFRLHSPALH